MFTTKKIAVVSVINDLATDHRVYKTCVVLVDCGYEVILIGRKLPQSSDLPKWSFRSVRMKLHFVTGPLFYLFFNLRLFFRLLFLKTDLLFANDLDTLLPNFIVSRLKGIPLVYDSHELFTEVPELQNTPLKKKIWKKLEQMIVPRLNHCITVSESIALIFEKEYHVKFTVVRNIPYSSTLPDAKTKQDLGLPLDKKIILLQGSGINIDRGAEELVEAMAFLDGCLLLIIGAGDVWPVLQQKIRGDLVNKVMLINRLPREELKHYTHLADIGVSLDKNTNLNYFYSLPNKIFDYIHAGIPVMASRLPEIEKIVNTYEVGEFLTDHNPRSIASKLKEMLGSDKLKQYKANAEQARKELNWDREKEKLISVIKGV